MLSQGILKEDKRYIYLQINWSAGVKLLPNKNQFDFMHSMRSIAVPIQFL